MLVFTRRKHEAIMIGDGVEVRILRVGKEGVRLGIVAPPEVRVHRREIYDQIRDANQSAVVSPGQFTAQLVGLPELAATAATREEAIQQVRKRLAEYLASGRLVLVGAPHPLMQWSGHADPNDPLEKEFLEELERLRREDLEQTLRENEQECSNSSSTPTT